MKRTVVLLGLLALALVAAGTTQAAPSTYLVAPAGQVSAVTFGFAGTIKGPVTPAFWFVPRFAAASCDGLAGLTAVDASDPGATLGWSIRGHGRAEKWTYDFTVSAPAGSCLTVSQELTDGSFTDPQLILISP